MSNGNYNRQELEQQMLELIEEHLEHPVELDTPLREICDDLDLMELFMAVEEEFEVEISPEDEELRETPADFGGCVRQHTDD